MTERKRKALLIAMFGSLVLAITAGFSPAQPIPLYPPTPAIPTLPGDPAFPAQPAEQADEEDIDVLAKGPVHEAFATTAEPPEAPPVVAKKPPDPIEELPPEQKPEGDNVQWIPGYWHWDEEVSKFIWISGFWRQPPPGRVWVPGSWREVKGGWQWVPGFWQEVNAHPQQPAQPEIEYLPQPPQSIEIGPSVPSPGEAFFYSPGSWVWRGRYVWRPGSWIGYRSNWLWVPARYHWTPAGFVFCDGYWDYPLARRGVLFAPVFFQRPIYTRPAFFYTPRFIVSEPCFYGALFVRRGFGHYYFGDYFAPRYNTLGFNAFCGTYGRNGFAIGFGTGRTWGYDPLWCHYSTHFRHSPRWQSSINDLYVGRYRGDIVRPPATLVQQNAAINNITNRNVGNATNNIVVVHGTPQVNNRDVSNVAMVAPLRVAPDLQQTRFQTVNDDGRRNEAIAAKQLRDVGVQRTKLETAVVNQPKAVVPPGTAPPVVQPQTIKLDVPKTAATRAQVTDENKAPPPNPLRATGGNNTAAGNRPLPKIEPKIEPKQPVNPPVVNPLPKVEPKQPANPLPKIDPKQPVNPLPKVEPKQPVNPPVNPLPVPKVDPKIDPRPTPKVEPKIDPKIEPRPLPKVDPKQPVNPPVNPLPKIEPKQPVNPPVVPKVDPKPVTPVNPLPKIDPKPVTPVNPPKVNPQPVTPPPANSLPKIEPKPVTPLPVVNPLPKIEPKVEPRPVPKVDPKPLVNPPVQPKVEPKPIVNPPPPPKIEPRPVSPTPVQPKVNPQPVNPTPIQPKINPQPQPLPKVNPQPQPVPQPAPRPVVNPPPQPRPVVQPPPQPRPAPQPAPRPPAPAPKAPAGKPPGKR